MSVGIALGVEVGTGVGVGVAVNGVGRAVSVALVFAVGVAVSSGMTLRSMLTSKVRHAGRKSKVNTRSKERRTDELQCLCLVIATSH